MGKYALLIGVGEYGEGLTSLPAAPRDVVAFAEVLQNPQMGGFDEVKPLINPNQAEMAREIELWFRGREPDDLVLLFFSGHGVKDNDRKLFFAARDTEKRRDDLITSTATSAQVIHGYIRRCKAKYQVIILDCCFSGAFGNQLARDDGEINLKDQLGAEGCVVLTATNEVGYAFEEKGADLSIYTRYLVEGIVSGAADEDEDGVITVEELHRFAGRKVEKTSPAMSPKIIMLKDEGYRIRLARSPQDDPKVKYRKDAERRVASGRFSFAARQVLLLLRQELEISDIEAEAIESEVLKPFQEYKQKRQKYEDTLRQCLQEESPLSPNTIRDLMDLRERLRLRPEDVSAIDQAEATSPSLSDNTAGHKSSPLVFFPPQATNTSPSTFTDYRKVLATLISDLERLRHYSQVLSLNSSIQPIDDVLERVQSNSFSVAVVGGFKRGKSTFINALLGQDILPSDILPCSATINRVTYGVLPRVKIVYRDGREEKEIAIDQLADYVTKLTPESEEKAIHIKEAVVYYPVFYCQNNVDIIDTPGLSDDETMTAVTLSVLPRVDVAILVVMALSPLSESDRAFLEGHLLYEDLGRILFVITGIDRCSRPDDVEKIVTNLKNRIRTYILNGIEKRYGKDSEKYKACISTIVQPNVFPMSAYQALQAKQTGDGELLTKSRFPEFEAALEKLLTEERGVLFLQMPINRLIASSTEILSALNLRQNALVMKKEEF